MSAAAASGSVPVWREIVTGAGGKAVEFYTRLLGWKAEEQDMGPGGKYTLFSSGEKQIAGLMAVPDARSHWITYFSVADVDEAARIAKQAGGKILTPPKDIPEIGRFCLIQDPQGGVSAPFTGSSQTAPPAEAPFDFCWEELLTRDAEAAVGFYRKLYGWGQEDMDMGPSGIYHVMKAGEQSVAGVMRIPDEAGEVPSHWIPYIAAADVDGITEKAKTLGAKIHVPPRDIPSVGRFSVVADAVGATVAFYKAEVA